MIEASSGRPAKPPNDRVEPLMNTGKDENGTQDKHRTAHVPTLQAVAFPHQALQQKANAECTDQGGHDFRHQTRADAGKGPERQTEAAGEAKQLPER